MSLETKIQWCDTTVNPVAGCNGCELYPTTGRIVREIENLLSTCLSANGLSESPLKLADSHGGDWGEWPMAFRIRETPDAWHSPSELGLCAA